MTDRRGRTGVVRTRRVGFIGRSFRSRALNAASAPRRRTRRFRVRRGCPTTLPAADIESARRDPDDPRVHDLIVGARTRIRDIRRRARAIEETEPDDTDPEISDDPLLATYHLAGIAPLGPADRYRLLCADSPLQRLEILDDALDDIEAMIEFRRT